MEVRSCCHWDFLAFFLKVGVFLLAQLISSHGGFAEQSCCGLSLFIFRELSADGSHRVVTVNTKICVQDLSHAGWFPFYITKIKEGRTL